MKDLIKKREEEFDKQFVKDNGENVEPSFIDPNGSVGPIKQFHQETIDLVIKELIKELQEFEMEIIDKDGDIIECYHKSIKTYLEDIISNFKNSK